MGPAEKFSYIWLEMLNSGNGAEQTTLNRHRGLKKAVLLFGN